MESFLLGILVLVTVAGAVLSFQHVGKLSRMQIHIEQLERRLRAFEQKSASSKPAPRAESITTSKRDASASALEGVSKPRASSNPSSPPTLISYVEKHQQGLVNAIKGNGLLWLGGLVLAVGGIFLANYAIESGFVSAELRVILGGVFGVSLVVASEFLARHRIRFSIYSPAVCAALASGGVVTCYAMTLVAFNYYGFLSPFIAFATLAFIALGAVSLSLRFGPLLAFIGILGAFAIPALVNTGSNNIPLLLAFVSLVSLSGVWVAQKVAAVWLWRVSFLGQFLWALVGLSSTEASHFVAWLCFSVFSTYLFALVRTLGWSLMATQHQGMSLRSLFAQRQQLAAISLVLIVIHGFLIQYGSNEKIWISAFTLAALLLIAPIRHSAFDVWPALMLVTGLTHFAMLRPAEGPIDLSFILSGKYLFSQLLAVGLCVYGGMLARKHNTHDTARPAFWLYMVVSPVALYGVSYALAPSKITDVLYGIWALELALIALISALVTLRVNPHIEKLSFSVLANACLTLCFTMVLDAAILSLALAIQVAMVSIQSAKYRVALPDWLFKALLIAVLLRLTGAPWLADYADEHIFSIHWTAVVYPAVFLSLWLARKYNPSPTLKVWLEGALLHVVALFITTEPSYWLTGAYPELFLASYTEKVFLALGWVALAVTYWHRACVAQQLAKLYRVAGFILMIGAFWLHLDISVVNNPFVFPQNTGGNAVLNYMALQWLAPALLLSTLGLPPWFKVLPSSASQIKALISGPCLKGIVVIIGLFLVLYINSIIRRLFHHGHVEFGLGIGQAEQYTYSVVWLILATLTIFLGQYMHKDRAVKLGFGLLTVVLLKAFIIDMSSLEGLYRALSFIGLGLSLVGIGWLFQKFNMESDRPRDQASPVT